MQHLPYQQKVSLCLSYSMCYILSSKLIKEEVAKLTLPLDIYLTYDFHFTYLVLQF